MGGEKGERRYYSASEIEAELAKRRMCIAEDTVTLEAFEPESDDDRAWHKGMIARLGNARALVAIIEQLRGEHASSGEPDEAFTREHENAVARLRREKPVEFTSLRTERQKRG